MAADINRIANWPLARELNLRITSHATRRPEFLEEAGRAGLMGPDTTYIHCTTLSDETWQRISDTGGTISLALSSVSQLSVGAGMSPIQKALDVGIRPSLSVDVEACLPGDMFTQMRLALALQRGPSLERRIKKQETGTLLYARDVLEFVTVEGARALGMTRRIGSLAPGKQADLLLINANEVNNGPLNNAIGTIVSGSDPRNIEMVMVDGQILKWQGEIVHLDVEKILQEAQMARDYLAAASGYKLDILGPGYC